MFSADSLVLGYHGFPESIKNIETLLEIIKAGGDDIRALQAQVVLGYKQPLQAQTGKTVALNSRNILTIQLEKKFYASIKSSLMKLSSLTDIGFLAEEENNTISQKSYWVVDPICNIRDYIHGGQDWSISLGFAKDGMPTGGIIYYPAKGEILFTHEDEQSHRRLIEDSFKRETALTEYSSQHKVSASTLCDAFAETTKSLIKISNSDIFSNVALLAIANRIAIKPHLSPELPLALRPQ